MRTGYTYDDEMPSVQGSYVNNNYNRRRKFTGKRIGYIEVDPVTKEIRIRRFSIIGKLKQDVHRTI